MAYCLHSWDLLQYIQGLQAVLKFFGRPIFWHSWYGDRPGTPELPRSISVILTLKISKFQRKLVISFAESIDYENNTCIFIWCAIYNTACLPSKSERLELGTRRCRVKIILNLDWNGLKIAPVSDRKIAGAQRTSRKMFTFWRFRDTWPFLVVFFSKHLQLFHTFSLRSHFFPKKERRSPCDRRKRVRWRGVVVHDASHARRDCCGNGYHTNLDQK